MGETGSPVVAVPSLREFSGTACTGALLKQRVTVEEQTEQYVSTC
jgi:hypothetical protein